MTSYKSSYRNIKSTVIFFLDFRYVLKIIFDIIYGALYILFSFKATYVPWLIFWLSHFVYH